jgi:hypothetical protein
LSVVPIVLFSFMPETLGCRGSISGGRKLIVLEHDSTAVKSYDTFSA